MKKILVCPLCRYQSDSESADRLRYVDYLQDKSKYDDRYLCPCCVQAIEHCPICREKPNGVLVQREGERGLYDSNKVIEWSKNPPCTECKELINDPENICILCDRCDSLTVSDYTYMLQIFPNLARLTPVHVKQCPACKDVREQFFKYYTEADAKILEEIKSDLWHTAKILRKYYPR